MSDDGRGARPGRRTAAATAWWACASGSPCYGGELEAGPRAAPERRLRACGARLPLDAGGRVVIRVLIADDQALVRDGFGMILDAQPDIEVVGGAARRPRGDRHGRASCAPTWC